MKGLAVIIPVKGTEHKSRLSGFLRAGERRTFSRLMLDDVLAAVAQNRLLPQTFVVSSSEVMLRQASNSGAGALEESGDRGVNAAVEFALKKLEAYEHFLVLPSDLPLLRSSDVRAVLRLKRQGMAAVISPSASFNGTNVLLFSRSNPLDLSYDDDSFWKHTSSAAKRAVKIAVYASPGVLHDLDTSRDAKTALKSRINRSSLVFLRRASRRWVS